MIHRREFLAYSVPAATLALAATTPVMGQQSTCCEGTTIRLRDGRRLGYATYGHPQGWPVLYFHGIPTSRIEARFFAAAARDAGCRLIALDRPGYGLSDFQHHRRITDWTNDVCEFVTSHQLPPDMHLGQFSIACFSSGAAYALLCAAALPREQLKSIAIVDGIAPLQKIRGHGGYAQVIFELANNSPRVARAALNVSTRQLFRRPNVVMRRTSQFFSKRDEYLFHESTNRKNLIDSYLQCVHSGPEGVIYDMSLLARPWGFRLEDISRRVGLWYGACDITTPVNTMGSCLNHTLRNSTLTVFPGEGHLSMLNRAGPQLFQHLLTQSL